MEPGVPCHARASSSSPVLQLSPCPAASSLCAAPFGCPNVVGTWRTAGSIQLQRRVPSCQEREKYSQGFPTSSGGGEWCSKGAVRGKGGTESSCRP